MSAPVTKRLIDILVSVVAIAALSPILVVIGIAVVTTSAGGVFFRGVRVGQHGELFRIFKFRTMRPDSEGNGKWNVGQDDERVTPLGRLLRKTKLDELPQLINVLIGDMSVVGPRPELPHYVAMYTDAQKPILDLKPGITDWASLVHYAQYEVFTGAGDPDEAYLLHIRPLKLRMQGHYREHHTLRGDLRILLWTAYSFLSGSKRVPKDVQRMVSQWRQEEQQTDG